MPLKSNTRPTGSISRTFADLRLCVPTAKRYKDGNWATLTSRDRSSRLWGGDNGTALGMVSHAYGGHLGTDEVNVGRTMHATVAIEGE